LDGWGGEEGEIKKEGGATFYLFNVTRGGGPLPFFSFESANRVFEGSLLGWPGQTIERGSLLFFQKNADL